jgi:DNA-binding NtrC family response regulator
MLLDVQVELFPLDIPDPTRHTEIYAAVRNQVMPRLRGWAEVHVNVSPGTPAMHSVWIVLHAGGNMPAGTRLWSSQMSPETKRTRIDPVDFPITTYLSEVHRLSEAAPSLAVYEPQARSPARRQAFERLARYARLQDAPLLILGERGTGKTRLVETLVASLKRREKVVTLPCGGLDSTLADSLLFGHAKGAFTGADAARPGLLAEANGGILFLDEVQDLPKPAQRKLVRVFQGGQQRFRRVGCDKEEAVDVELVCASNQGMSFLRAELDADLFDRISHLSVELPPLRECRDDVQGDWANVWRELRRLEDLPETAPWNNAMQEALARHDLAGNLRDLQRLALLLMAWWPDFPHDGAIARAIEEWRRDAPEMPAGTSEFGSGTRKDRINWFSARLAHWAKGRFGTWGAAAEALGCDEKTLRQDLHSLKHDEDGQSVHIP